MQIDLSELERVIADCRQGLDGIAGEAELATRVQTRDRAESTLSAIDWVASFHDVVPAAIQGYDGLLEHLRQHDRDLGRSIDEESLIGALGERRALASRDAWVWRCEAVSRAPRALPPVPEPFPVKGDLPANLGPNDSTVVAYLTGGYHRSWVEGFAARSTGFRELLDGTFEVLSESGEALSLAAYRWRRSLRGGGKRRDPIQMDVWTVKAAASTVPSVDERTLTVNLGVLPGVQAVAMLRVFEARLELMVTALAGAELAQVALNGVTTQQSDATTGIWVVTVPRDQKNATFEFTVLAEDGSRFEERVELSAR